MNTMAQIIFLKDNMLSRQKWCNIRKCVLTQEPVRAALPSTLVCLVNAELFVSLVSHSGYRLVSLLPVPDRQPCVVRETSMELTRAQYFLISAV